MESVLYLYQRLYYINHKIKSIRDILELKNLLKIYYTQKVKAAKIHSRIKWAEEGERSTRYFFELEKKQGDDAWHLSQFFSCK
jgi:hypothetical protein